MIHKISKIKYFVISVWLLFLSFSLYTYFFQGNLIQTKLSLIFGSSALLGYTIYLLAGCLRGFTFIPITYFLFLGILLLPPWPLYFLTLIGVLTSSACIYYFSEYLGFDEYFENVHEKHIIRIKKFLAKNELPVVIAWSFFPFLPTDLICYVCGSLRMDIRKFLLGVFIGEGISCAIYIFLGKEILNYVKF